MVRCNIIYRTTLTMLLVVAYTSLFGQDSWQLVSNTGGFGSNQFASSEFSIGDLVVGNSDNSNTYLFTYGYNQGWTQNNDIPTGNTNKLSSNVAIYPNPTKDAFQVRGVDGLVNLNISDLSGRQVFAKQVSANEEVSVGSLPQGVYLVKITTAEGTIEKKLIKR